MSEQERRRARNWRALRQIAEGKQLSRTEKIERGLTVRAIAARFGVSRVRLYQFAREMQDLVNGSAA